MSHLFSIAVHNRMVKRAVAKGRHFGGLSDGWAYVNYLQVKANSLEQARARIMRHLPATKGFVVGAIELSHNHGWNKSLQ